MYCYAFVHVCKHDKQEVLYLQQALCTPSSRLVSSRIRITDSWNIIIRTSEHFSTNQSIFEHQHNSITTVFRSRLSRHCGERQEGREYTFTKLSWSPRGDSKRAALQSFSIRRLMCREHSHSVLWIKSVLARK